MRKIDSVSKKEFQKLSTDELRENFLIDIFEKDEISVTYTYYDRMVVIGINPVKKILNLPSGEIINSAFFLENRELGLINLGGKGEVIVDGAKFEVKHEDALYISKGSKEISFKSLDEKKPALFYCLSSTAHRECQTRLIKIDEANKINLGSKDDLNERTIYQFIHPSVLETCQLSLGLTKLEKGSVWNTCPPHTHDRRMEVYLYNEIDEKDVVFHIMGEKDNTRHIVVKNNQVVVNPSWSLHFGTSTSNYNFVWAMAGENKNFTDMDVVNVNELK